MSKGSAKVRLVFVDDGEYRDETIEIPAAALDRHERLIDCLREDPEVLGRVFVDVDRLVAASVRHD
jgi:hypothetical protein